MKRLNVWYKGEELMACLAGTLYKKRVEKTPKT